MSASSALAPPESTAVVAKDALRTPLTLKLSGQLRSSRVLHSRSETAQTNASSWRQLALDAKRSSPTSSYAPQRIQLQVKS